MADEKGLLDYLLGAFMDEAVEYTRIQPPRSAEGKRRLLRSLMNVRPPAPLDKGVEKAQDIYLKGRAIEKGIVPLDVIPVKRGRLSLWQGDITRLQIDAIVNAANSGMLGCFAPLHGCIDNCIHTYAGVQLRWECYKIMNDKRAKYGEGYEQPTAVPIMTGGYNLPARRIIHVVGPIVEGELQPSHEAALEACYRNVMDMCEENDIRSVAFPCISTGVFMFPKRRAAEIACQTVGDYLSAHSGIERVVFCVFSDEDRAIYESLLD